MANNSIRVGDVEIMALSDGTLEFDLCNFFPTIPADDWRQYASHLTEGHKVRFNLGSYLIRSAGPAHARLPGPGRAARRRRHGGDDPSAPRPRRLEFGRTGREVCADLSERSLLDEREGLGSLPPARRPAPALPQRPRLCLAAGRARPGGADGGGAQHHA